MRVLVGAVMLAVSAPAAGASLTEAKSAYERNRVAEAERLYAAVDADRAATAADRSVAQRELARIAWLIDGDAPRALGHLAAARTIGDKPCETAEMMARVLREAGQHREAVGRAETLIASCPETDKRDGIRTHLIGARLDLAAANSDDRAQLLAAAVAEGAQFSIEADVEAARVRLESAVLTGNAPAALAAWRDYFWLDKADAPQALAGRGVTAILEKGLGAGASVDDRLSLADLLMRAGFAQVSRRYAAAHGLARSAAGTPTWRRLEAYWRERDRLDAVLLRVNRGLARGKRDDQALETAAKAATVALMQAAGVSGDPRAVLRESYGLVGTVGKTSGYPSMHMGHVIEDREDSITQYGRTAAIHYMAIDNMIGNGFESWLWDGSAMVGGWTADGVIVHIRPGYVRSPSRAYRLTQDGPSRRELIGRQAKRAAEDMAKLKARPVATLEGLNDRLQLQLVDQVWAGARSKARSEADARRAFLAEYSRANLDQSIRVHEGRHAIDNSIGLTDNVDQAVLEYRAKLSELALTAYPRMALHNMNRSLEGEGPHDRGGARVFDEYRKWMEAHTDQILGHDPAIPVLEQLDKLTDGQLREIARGLDPLAQTVPAKPE